MRDLIVAAYQMNILSGEKNQNLEKVKSTIQSNHRKEIDLWVFPELFTTGFAYSHFPKLAEKQDESYTLKFLEKLSDEYSITIASSVLFHGNKNGKYQNVGFVLTPSKGVVYSYPKVHLWIPERDHFIAGNQLSSPVDIEGKAKVGLSICYDLRFPEVSRKMVLEGAEVLITPSAWPEPRIHHFNLLTETRALENTCFHIAVNRLGIDLEPEHTKYSGSSRIIDPWGQVLAGASYFEQVIIACLHGKFLDETRKLLPVLKHRKIDFFSD